MKVFVEDEFGNRTKLPEFPEDKIELLDAAIFWMGSFMQVRSRTQNPEVIIQNSDSEISFQEKGLSFRFVIIRE